jgi:hypothetical protein
MPVLSITIVTTDSISELNSKVLNSGDPSIIVANLQNYLTRGRIGACDGTVQVTTRDTDPAVGTSGAGSQQITYTI